MLRYEDTPCSAPAKDHKIALKFHELREANPHLFPHRAVNKAWYANYGMLEMLKTSHPLASYTTLKVRDNFNWWLRCILLTFLQVDDAVIPLNETVASIIVLNIPSYTGGSDLWGKPKSKEKQWKVCLYLYLVRSRLIQPAMMNDGVLEVVSISGVFHMGSIQAHLAKAKKIAQGARVEIESRELGTKAVQLLLVVASSPLPILRSPVFSSRLFASRRRAMGAASLSDHCESLQLRQYASPGGRC